MNDEIEKANSQDSAAKQPKVKLSFKGFLGGLLIVIIVICSIVGYNFYLQKQLASLRQESLLTARKIKQLELNNVPDISTRQLAEKLDFVMNQQEANLTATQEMIDYLTFTFTLIGVFFLLVSGYFIYRQYRTENREDEGWMLAKGLLELVTQSQQFVVRVQDELKRQKEELRKQLYDTVNFLNNRSDAFIKQFYRDTISKGINFSRLVDISNRIDNTRFQLRTFDLTFKPNCYFLKAVYEYIIGNYNSAKEEFDNLILTRKEKVLTPNEEKQLSLCYYYRGLIEYNIQENLKNAEEFANLAVERDPKINGPDYKSMLMKAEIDFKMGKDEAFDEYEAIVNRLNREDVLNDTQNRLRSYAYLGMAYCKLLAGGKKFLPEYYESIRQIENEVILQAIEWLNLSTNCHFYTFLTLGQLSIIFEENRTTFDLNSPDTYLSDPYNIIQNIRPHEMKEETRSKILAYSVKLVCEKMLNHSSFENTKLIIKDLMNDEEMKSVYSIFSKVNVAKAEFVEELGAFGIQI